MFTYGVVLLTVCLSEPCLCRDIQTAYAVFEEFVPRLVDGEASLLVFNALLSLCALHRHLDAAQTTLGHIKV